MRLRHTRLGPLVSAVALSLLGAAANRVVPVVGQSSDGRGTNILRGAELGAVVGAIFGRWGARDRWVQAVVPGSGGRR